MGSYRDWQRAFSTSIVYEVAWVGETIGSRSRMVAINSMPREFIAGPGEWAIAMVIDSEHAGIEAESEGSAEFCAALEGFWRWVALYDEGFLNLGEGIAVGNSANSAHRTAAVITRANEHRVRQWRDASLYFIKRAIEEILHRT